MPPCTPTPLARAATQPPRRTRHANAAGTRCDATTATHTARQRRWHALRRNRRDAHGTPRTPSTARGVRRRRKC
eukprot:350031-Chlamydomonas_euryale.AAC.1